MRAEAAKVLELKPRRTAPTPFAGVDYPVAVCAESLFQFKITGWSGFSTQFAGGSNPTDGPETG